MGAAVVGDQVQAHVVRCLAVELAREVQPVTVCRCVCRAAVGGEDLAVELGQLANSVTVPWCL